MWTDPATGKRVTVWAFVMVLSHSRHMFVRPVLKMDQQAWTQAHVEAFAFFGGVPARIVPDNLATGVDRADLYDPKLNRAYCRAGRALRGAGRPGPGRKPRDKARVERPMPYVRDSFGRGRDFATLAQMASRRGGWCRGRAGQRACRPLDGAAPAAVFAAVEPKR
jgi:transposase